MADPQERSTPGLMADLLDQVTQLLRKEVQLFRAEMNDKATQAVVAAGSILAAAVIAITALNVLAGALVVALANAGIPGPWSAVIVGVGPGDRRFRDGEEGHRQPQGREPGTGADNPRRGSGRLDGEGENLMAEFSTNPGDRSVTELEREVDRERERVSATIDELQARASVGSLVDQLVKAVGENGGEVSRNLGRSLRDNPLAALLTGVGLAWLMAGSGRPRDEAEIGTTRTATTCATGGIAFQRRRCPARPPTEAALREHGRAQSIPNPGQDEEGGLRERVADVAGRVGEGVSEAVGGVRERASGRPAPAPASRPRLGDTCGTAMIPSAAPAAPCATCRTPRVAARPGRATTCARGSTP